MPTRREAVALVAVMASTAVFMTAVRDIQALTIGESGLGHSRPHGTTAVSAWFGQLAAARMDTDTMLIPAEIMSSSVESVALATGDGLNAVSPLHPAAKCVARRGRSRHDWR